jgi:hypothetical protein
MSPIPSEYIGPHGGGKIFICPGEILLVMIKNPAEPMYELTLFFEKRGFP